MNEKPSLRMALGVQEPTMKNAIPRASATPTPGFRAPALPSAGFSFTYGGHRVSGKASMEVDWATARKCCDEYRRIRRFFPCDFHNLGSAGMDPTAWAIWQYHDPEAGEGVVLAFRRSQSPSDRAVVALHGIPAGATIETENLDTGEKAVVAANALALHLAERRSSTVMLYRIAQP